MKVFAISDLHLTGKSDKPMNVFGKIWDNYVEKIEESWRANVSDNDLVLLAGDLSWAMRLYDVDLDLGFLASLPGKKIIIKGNHDYWWQTISKVRSVLPNNVFALQNDSIRFDNVLICGTRGWTCPNANDFTADDNKIYLRESERLELSLKSMDAVRLEGDEVIAMMHYPPFNVRRDPSNFTDSFEKHNVKKVIYGHLHGNDSLSIKKTVKNGVEYYLTSCDLVGFELQRIL